MTEESKNEAENADASAIEEAYESLAVWWRTLDATSKKEALNSGFPTLFSYNSGRIENDSITFHDTKEVFDNDRVISFTGDTRTLFEIANLKAAWNKITALSSSKEPLGIEDILDIHFTLTYGTYDEARWVKGERPGIFKQGDYVVAGNVGLNPSEVPEAISSLLDELSEWSSAAKRPSPAQTLVVSCYAHAALVDIHPFADGNGRTARAVQNIILMRGDCPPVCIDERDRMAYYGALDAFYEEGDLDHFTRFCMVESLKTWNDPKPLACRADDPESSVF